MRKVGDLMFEPMTLLFIALIVEHGLLLRYALRQRNGTRRLITARRMQGH